MVHLIRYLGHCVASGLTAKTIKDATNVLTQLGANPGTPPAHQTANRPLNRAERRKNKKK